MPDPRAQWNADLQEALLQVNREHSPIQPLIKARA
jgi:hypothetical protein